MAEKISESFEEEVTAHTPHVDAMKKKLAEIQPKSLSTPMRTVMLLAENKLQKAQLEAFKHQGDEKYLDAMAAAEEQYARAVERTKKLATTVATIYGRDT